MAFGKRSGEGRLRSLRAWTIAQTNAFWVPFCMPLHPGLLIPHLEHSFKAQMVTFLAFQLGTQLQPHPSRLDHSFKAEMVTFWVNSRLSGNHISKPFINDKVYKGILLGWHSWFFACVNHCANQLFLIPFLWAASLGITDFAFRLSF